MKKTYRKPTIHIEKFNLVQTTAMGCGSNLDFSNATQGTITTCGWNAIPGFEIFQDGAVCDNLVEEWGDACYNNPEGGLNVFSS